MLLGGRLRPSTRHTSSYILKSTKVFVRTDLHDQTTSSIKKFGEKKSQGTELDMYHLAYEHEGYLDGTS